jgi:alkaline phosphatase D
MGVASGDAHARGTLLWTHHPRAEALTLVVYAMDGASFVAEVARAIVLSEDGYFRAEVDDLDAYSSYSYVFVTAEDPPRRSPIGRFRTAPADDALVPLRFGATACTRNDRPMPVLERAAAHDLDAFIHLGDASYNDGSSTLGEFRARWASNLEKPGYKALRASTSLVATWDDHEITNDYNPETANAGLIARATHAFFEHQPVRPTIAADGTKRLWRRLRWGKTAELFVLDSRSERRPSTRSTARATYLSQAQLDWLVSGLTSSDAVFKIVVNSVPIGDFPGLLDLLRADRWEGYAAQREALLAAVDRAGVRGVLWLAGDFHFASVGRVSASGAGSSALEVLAGPGAQTRNYLATLCVPPQFDFASSVNNFCRLDLDPAAATVRVRHIDERGGTLFDGTYAP